MVKYKVWNCKIVMPYDAELPSGFDRPPRRVAIEAVENAGVHVISCFSGWGGTLTKTELEVLNEGLSNGH